MIEQTIDSSVAVEPRLAEPLRAFARANRLKGFQYDECDDAMIKGRFGHLFVWSEDTWGLCLIGAGAQALERRKREAVAAGFSLELVCDFGDTVLHFDPAKKDHAKLAVRLAGIRKKRTVSPEQLESMKLTLAIARTKIPRPQ